MLDQAEFIDMGSLNILDVILQLMELERALTVCWDC